MTKPRYQHDCDRCWFLCQVEHYDIYFCPAGENTAHIDPGTMIARYDDDGLAYASYPVASSFKETPRFPSQAACLYGWNKLQREQNPTAQFRNGRQWFTKLAP